MRIIGPKKLPLTLAVTPQPEPRTNTTIFLLPALSLPQQELKKQGFINAYLADHEHDIRYKQAIYVLLRPEKLEQGCWQFVRGQYDHPLFLEDYDIAGQHIMLVYRFPPRYQKEYSCFEKGKYSRFSKKYVQAYFPMVMNEVREGKQVTVATIFSGIFNREPWLRGYWEERLGLDPALRLLPDEYWSVPQERTEVFRFPSV